MLLVDTTVWIDFFAGKTTPQVSVLELMISEGEDICVCGIVLTEILQGIRNDSRYAKTKALFDNLIFLPMARATFLRSAEIYRFLRKKGITIRKPLDCMIAAVALAHNVQFLHSDKDFAPIEKHFGLKAVKIRKR